MLFYIGQVPGGFLFYIADAEVTAHIDISRKCDIVTDMNTRDILKALDNDIRLQILGWLKEPEKDFQCRQIRCRKEEPLKGGLCRLYL